MRLLATALFALISSVGAFAGGAEGGDSIYVNAKDIEVASLLQALKQLSGEEILVSPPLGLNGISLSGEFPNALAMLERLASTLQTVAGKGEGFLYLGQQPKSIQVQRSPERENNCPHRYSDLRLAQERAHPTGLRKCESLEYFPLSGLRVAGIISQDDKTFALIVSPDGVAWSVRTGDYLGQELGRIHAISRSVVALREIRLRDDGEWVEVLTELEPR